MERFYSRPATRLDPATDANPLVFEGLKHDPTGLEGRQRAL
jgi:hypothetical protein